MPIMMCEGSETFAGSDQFKSIFDDIFKNIKRDDHKTVLFEDIFY